MKAPNTMGCPKCGGVAHGPRYQTPRFPLYQEVLKYVCACGYEQFIPTQDAQPEQASTLPVQFKNMPDGS